MNPQQPAFTRLLMSSPTIRIQSGSIRRRIRYVAGEKVLGNEKEMIVVLEPAHIPHLEQPIFRKKNLKKNEWAQMAVPCKFMEQNDFLKKLVKLVTWNVSSTMGAELST